MPCRLAHTTNVLLLLAILPGLASAQYSSSGGSSSQEPAMLESTFRRVEILMEAGLALPQGDLSAPADTTFQGFGASSGYLLGLRTRIYLSPGFALAPYLSYTEFKEAEVEFYGRETLIQTKVINVGLDATYVKPGPDTRVRPLLAAGVALTRDMYRDEDVEDETFYKANVNLLTWSLTAGLRWRDWELSAYYQFNQVDTARFYPTGESRDYDWNHVVVRLGYVLPAI